MKSSDLHIRRLEPGDAQAYQALRLRGLREQPRAFTSSYEEESGKPLAYAQQRLSSASSACFWGAFAGGQMVGVVGLDREPRIKNRHKAVVIGMYVLPEHERQGIARALLNTVLEMARGGDLEMLVLTVTSGNVGAERLYREAGFVSFGVEPGAIKVENQRFDKNHMFLHITPP